MQEAVNRILLPIYPPSTDLPLPEMSLANSNKGLQNEDPLLNHDVEETSRTDAYSDEETDEPMPFHMHSRRPSQSASSVDEYEQEEERSGETSSYIPHTRSLRPPVPVPMPLLEGKAESGFGGRVKMHDSDYEAMAHFINDLGHEPRWSDWKAFYELVSATEEICTITGDMPA